MIIADYLKHVGYDYSLSVFVPEAHIETNASFRPYDVLQLIGVSHADLASPAVEKLLNVSGEMIVFYCCSWRMGIVFYQIL